MSRAEIQRLIWGPEPGQSIGGLGTVRIIARCAGESEHVLAKVKEVLSILISNEPISTSDVAKWQKALPDWLVSRFVPEPTKEEMNAYLALPYEERMKPEHNRPSLKGWLYWFQPENRYWYWWDAAVVDNDRLMVAIEVREWPFPWGALKWLLEAAGAASVEAED